jgi:mono/diheme cytochrome c family protein
LGAVAVTGVLLVLGACGGGDGGTGRASAAAPRPRGTLAADAEVQLGRRLFTDYCSTCHGIDGRGGVGPSFRGGTLLRDFATDEDQVDFVRAGKAIMPGFGSQLSEAELRAVVRYEREVVSPLAP